MRFAQKSKGVLQNALLGLKSQKNVSIKLLGTADFGGSQ
jgi:hypothetical protein